MSISGQFSFLLQMESDINLDFVVVVVCCWANQAVSPECNMHASACICMHNAAIKSNAEL